MSQEQLDKAKTFASLHAGPETFVIPNPWDIGTTQILTGMGFKALATTSAGYAFSRGCTDGIIGRDEMLAHAAEIVAATHLPISADLEDCYGNIPEEAAETIRLAAGTGLVGASIEDCTDGAIIDFNLAVEKVEAAAAAAQAQDFPFALTARSENFIRGNPDLDDTIRRLQAFEAAGADVLYAPGLPSLEAIRTICQSVGRPVNVVMGLTGGTMSTAQLADAGVRRISLGGVLARAALGAFIAAAEEIQAGSYTFVDNAASFGKISQHMKRPEQT
ncbi:MAG: isocitrate lyase/phosphoenolpyruvate mutase family protein [Alphaproteobacteria bacterium]|jgi:2-methylisocitrate lyase-like PEP mutase family enzyme|nr:2-methylisocitrate lyase [Rhodospirillaceae bacterium]MDP6021405.1 isocitrate lyase/phosphoenolpyruvate mutase family protein [Alphaproteobacteria bacterium]MDP6257103.1 isocitrate lyase/phosphoenolpyruvate mutase family protein [Alphaproteobacteria bacterium]MDP7056614.1 isocitrate lyase/phosphoenolpyruvate mutase family protein [Alphaproteobacteria bacterium]MDP7230331.1 isocitrate lyase/phosphoenolpyruvate mutase family protein [Alphaproteobacteria bacterium]|tara:strand:- start:1369 stop:2193 length:825 start_codon:yes stop_codon:yes gene_type:complete